MAIDALLFIAVIGKDPASSIAMDSLRFITEWSKEEFEANVKEIIQQIVLFPPDAGGIH